MEKIMTFETLDNFCYCNHRVCKRPIKGIVLTLNGLGFGTMYKEEGRTESRFYDEHGIIQIVPYYNPWCWMNRQTVDYVDELIDVVIAGLNLPADIPIVSTGNSMGGLCSLVYTAYAKHTPSFTLANCPVCDLPYHYTERPDLQRTLYSAFGSYEGTMAEALQSASPVHLVDQMPDIPYLIYHCTADDQVNKQKHSDVFVEKMQKAHRVEYIAVPDRGHCDLPQDVKDQFYQKINDFLSK